MQEEQLRPLAPEPPKGYQSAKQFILPRRGLQIFGSLFMLLCIPLWIIVAWMLQGFPNSGSFTLSPLALLVIVLVFPVTIAIHELLHGIAGRLLGYHMTYGVDRELPGFYAAAFGQFLKWSHNILIALVPLVVLTLVLVPLLSVQNALVVTGVITALVINTSGAIGDMYIVWYLLRQPKETLFYDSDIKHSFVFVPQWVELTEK